MSLSVFSDSAFALLHGVAWSQKMSRPALAAVLPAPSCGMLGRCLSLSIHNRTLLVVRTGPNGRRLN
ncbi:hypothetical protein RBSWK_01468 [Rhodopirellula baltica SWK14]|uniref:Uncharacterized protein n=1 Tax=Rhodopirellula baltica SWK14 TaxID=993516 RepID=L7CJY7_RHOBT|nr:hypothetical protein RBSWK_01468 [Rhodopirellula baltica SWK14]